MPAAAVVRGLANNRLGDRPEPKRLSRQMSLVGEAGLDCQQRQLAARMLMLSHQRQEPLEPEASDGAAHPSLRGLHHDAAETQLFEESATDLAGPDRSRQSLPQGAVVGTTVSAASPR